MDETIDLLKMKIERAKELLPKETVGAIDAVPWREVIYNMRERKGFNLTQLEDLELETELVLCGLVPPEKYPTELATRMGLSHPQVTVLVEEMNELVFKKIREELVKRISSNKALGLDTKTPTPNNSFVNTEDANQRTVDIKVIKQAIAQKEEDKNNIINSILGQKLSGAHISPQTKTEYSLGNISRPEESKTTPKSVPADPYRMNPGE